MTDPDRFRRWYEYEKHSHAQVLTSLEAVPEAQRSSPAFKKAVTLLAHIMAARRLWLFRMGRAAAGPREFFPEGVSLDDLRREIAEVEEIWSHYFVALDAAEVARVFEYQSMEGPWFRNTIE